MADSHGELFGGESSDNLFLIDTSDREDYASAKQAIMRCLGPPIATRIDQVGVLRWSKEESVAEMWE